MIGMQPSRTKRVMYALLNTHFCPIVDGKYLMETGPSVCPTFTHISQIRKWSSPSESHSSKDKNIDFPFLKMGRNIKMWTWKAFWFFPKFKQLSRSWDLSVRAMGLAHLHLASCVGVWLLCCKWKSIYLFVDLNVMMCAHSLLVPSKSQELRPWELKGCAMGTWPQLTSWGWPSTGRSEGETSKDWQLGLVWQSPHQGPPLISETLVGSQATVSRTLGAHSHSGLAKTRKKALCSWEWHSRGT